MDGGYKSEVRKTLTRVIKENDTEDENDENDYRDSDGRETVEIREGKVNCGTIDFRSRTS